MVLEKEYKILFYCGSSPHSHPQCIIFSEFLLHHMANTALNAADTSLIKTGKVPALRETYYPVRDIKIWFLFFFKSTFLKFGLQTIKCTLCLSIQWISTHISTHITNDHHNQDTERCHHRRSRSRTQVNPFFTRLSRSPPATPLCSHWRSLPLWFGLDFL